MKYITWLIVPFFIIGILYQLLSSPMSILGPLLLIALLYYLYRYPPQWLVRMSYPPSKPKNHTKKKSRFKVISGKK